MEPGGGATQLVDRGAMSAADWATRMCSAIFQNPGAPPARLASQGVLSSLALRPQDILSRCGRCDLTSVAGNFKPRRDRCILWRRRPPSLSDAQGAHSSRFGRNVHREVQMVVEEVRLKSRTSAGPQWRRPTPTPPRRHRLQLRQRNGRLNRWGSTPSGDRGGAGGAQGAGAGGTAG